MATTTALAPVGAPLRDVVTSILRSNGGTMHARDVRVALEANGYQLSRADPMGTVVASLGYAIRHGDVERVGPNLFRCVQELPRLEAPEVLTNRATTAPERCPRCGGNIWREELRDGNDYACLQCGWRLLTGKRSKLWQRLRERSEEEVHP